MPRVEDELAFIEAQFSTPRLRQLVAEAREHHERSKTLSTR